MWQHKQDLLCHVYYSEDNLEIFPRSQQLPGDVYESTEELGLRASN
jgi:hypothetical protein